MAEVVVGAFVTVLIQKLLTTVELMNFAGSEGIDSQLKKWSETLSVIQSVLADAGQKEITQKRVQVWLRNLQILAYHIDDVVDDIATELMTRKLNQEESHGTTSKIMKIIPASSTNFTPHNLMYGRKISSEKDKIDARLHDLFQQKTDLGLNENVKESTYKPLEETSLLDDESEILGRKEDRQALLKKLLGEEASNDHNVKIVSIVGLGGVGKTTLARVLYNDKDVKLCFKRRAWVWVSNEFDVFNISKAIYQAVGGNEKFANLDSLHVALKNKLSIERFLLVLDDVRIDDLDKWTSLKKPLVGAPGSKVIVTTQNTMVALAMNSVEPHNLGLLPEEIGLTLLAHCALEKQNFDKHPSLKSIAQHIVKKCDGLPLALVTLGRVLKTKGTDDVEWKELLESEIWSSQNGSRILPALKLSYYHLPSYLKQVFSYCSIFSKDRDFEKNNLILLWMAQGFLSQREGNQSMERLGATYFKELLSRSFFQPLGNDESRYKMHDLMNDLATSVAGNFSFRLDKKTDLNGNNEAYEDLHHFSFIGQQEVVEHEKFKELHRATRLRTFSLSGGWKGSENNRSVRILDDVTAKLLPKLRLLRVLSLTDYSIIKVPKSIGHLKHLRYLNFFETDIQEIPKEVSKLYNLQSLLVRGCQKLSSLPTSFVKLINLRHLDMARTPLLDKIPLGIGGLTSLQTLSKVVIQEDNGFKVAELEGLNNLQGELSIEGLEKVIDPTEAKDANLQQKDLADLQLVWLGDFRNTTNKDEVIENLRPHSKLKTLRIIGYGGMNFPSWLGDPSFDQLTELVLAKCKNCRELPILEHLTSLRKLEINMCSDLVNVGSSIMGSLRQVNIKKCDALESYCCPNSVESLVIESCDSMTSLSFSKLHEDLPSSSSSSSSSNLKILQVKYCKSIKSICQEHLQSLTSLEEMCIHECLSMKDSFPSCGLWPPNLRKLVIGKLKKPMSEWGLQKYPSSLVELGLYGRNSGVVSFGIEKQDHNNTSSSCFLLPPSLTELRIANFEGMSVEVLKHLPRLQYLELKECLELRDVPETTLSLTVCVEP